MKALLLAILVLTCGCIADESDNVTETSQSSTGADTPTPVGQQDFLDPGDEPWPEESNGPPLPAPTPDPRMVEALNAYNAALAAKEAQWDLQHLPETDRIKKRAALKELKMGEWL